MISLTDTGLIFDKDVYKITDTNDNLLGSHPTLKLSLHQSASYASFLFAMYREDNSAESTAHHDKAAGTESHQRFALLPSLRSF